MKYESVILKRLIETYGVVGNPRYISEIIKEFIVQGKECYPNLFTYQSDWLAHIDEFGLNPTYTVSYTGQSIYAPNTLEKPIKSAILSGSTKYRDIDTGEFLETFEEGRNLELVSVKMPVLTVSNKNLFCDDILNGKEIKDTEGKYIARGAAPDKNNTFAITKGFKEATQYTFSASCLTDGTWTNMAIVYKDHPYNTATGFTNNTGVITSLVGKTIDYITVYGNKESYIYDIQLTESPSPSPYEPHKSNILTVNEDVTLRSNGSVYDELDCLAGKLTQRIDENGEVLSQDIVKTVDLTILDQNGQNVKHLMSFNGGTHFNTTSLEGSPLPVVSVSVETDLEEILMVCSLEGNTI